jgi:PAS domain S-box-containing protein
MCSGIFKDDGIKLTRRLWDELIHPEDQERVLEEYSRKFREKTAIIEVEYRVLTESGSYAWMMENGNVIEWNEKGTALRVSGILVDISNRKNSEVILENRVKDIAGTLKALQTERAAILRGLAGEINVRLIDPSLKIIWSNKMAKQKENLSNQETANHYCYKLIHGRTEPCPKCSARDAFETGEFQEEEFTLDNKQFFVTRSIPVKNDSGEVSGIIQMALNITRRKETEEGLRSTKQLLQSLLENSIMPISITGRDGRLQLVNRAWESVFGFNRDQCVGQTLKSFFSNNLAHYFDRTNERVLKSMTPIELEETVDLPAGPHYFHTVKFPLMDVNGLIVAVGAISMDITARKRVERQLTKRETDLKTKSQELSEMNSALRVLLKQREEDKKELEQRIVTNVTELVLPYAHKLKKTHLNEIQIRHLEILERHLADIITPFLHHIVSQYPHMTARELQVATFVREGKTNKEIADLLNISINAVQIHRYNVRKKLSLQNKKVNLRSYLLSLT